MKMHLDTSSSNLITDYGTDGISVNGQQYTKHLVVSQKSVTEGWAGGEITALRVEDFETVLTLTPELVLLGTGRTHMFVQAELYADFSARGCALEVMTTSAACRTYNVLIGEYRNVAAVLLQIT